VAIVDKLPGYLEPIPGGGIFLSALDLVINWARAYSIFPLSFGTKCCAIEMLMATGAPHQDLARFGSEIARPSPRQADLMVIAGTIVKRMAPRVLTLYEQMTEPKFVMATGSCAICGGPFIYNNYSVVRGVDEIIPVDIFVPGCPPRPEAFFYGLMLLQKLVKKGMPHAKPGQRKKPVLAALPSGITAADIRAELAQMLEAESLVKPAEIAANSPWQTKA
jgi:NADH-quinone oxidoreductase subunit B